MSKKFVEGYKSLSQRQIDAINSLKALERDAAELIKQIRQDVEPTPRHVALGITNLEQGFMWLTKAVAKPEEVF